MISEGIRRSAARRWWAGGAALAVLAAGFVAGPGSGAAQAAVPDRFGFVLWDGSAPVASGTTPAATTVTVLSVGRYSVVFPGQAATGGVVHVTAVNPTPHWCQVDSFGPSGADEKALISCYRVGGALDSSGFSAIFSSSSGGPASSVGQFGYVHSQPSGALVSQYNSAGAGNTVSHTGVGQWLVKFPGLATAGPVDGNLQSTAVNPQTPARCKVAAWSSSLSGQTVKVSCFNAGGAPLDTQFTLTYQYQRSLYGAVAPPKYFGYLWNSPPLGPLSTNFNSQVGPGANSISSSGVGLSLVQFPKLAAPPDNVQVTAAGSGSEFCGLSGVWFHSGVDLIVRNVNCFTNAGAAVNTGFLISANSRN